VVKRYKVTMLVEGAGGSVDDPEIEKIVEAESEKAAVDKARLLIRDENKEVNYLKIWARSIEELAE